VRNAGKFAGILALSLVGSSTVLCQQPPPQHMSSLDHDRATSMLGMIASDVKKHYYDPKFHGLDWDARVREAKQKIDESPTLNVAFSHIAGALDALNDSHTFFLPPRRPYKHDYGFQMMMVGDRCFVTRVRPQSDGESKGMKAGDEVLTLNGYAPARDNLWKMNYVNDILRPQPSLHLEVSSPSGSKRQLDVVAKMESSGTQVKDPMDIWNDRRRESEDSYLLMRPHSVEIGDLMILKIPIFLFSEMEANELIGKARKHKALILDLRSNPGGAVDSLKYLLGVLFESDITIAERVRREDRKQLVAKSHRNPFTGKIAVLVDSDSASASELLARIVQIEKRGPVIGDHSSGSVMEAERYQYQTGFGVVAVFGASITDADLIMTDGKSLEHTGVTPDEAVLPTAEDMASGRDPVMAHAAEVLGFKISPVEAGKFFPYEWPKQ
jgi:C-terminal processing protease CtpA/Prc